MAPEVGAHFYWQDEDLGAKIQAEIFNHSILENNGNDKIFSCNKHSNTFCNSDFLHNDVVNSSCNKTKNIFENSLNKMIGSIQYNCKVCPLAKQSKMKFPISSSKTKNLF